MKNKRLLILSGMVLSTLLFLSGCVQTDKSGNPTGLIWDWLGQPMSNLIRFFAEDQALGFGLAIIIVTLLVRFIILPLGIYQSWKAAIQSEKMNYLKPILGPIQERMKNASSQEEQLAAQQEYFATQKQYGVSMLGGIGCLPMLIQMPFFSAIYFAARHTPGISEATFLGINLGSTSLILTGVAGILYYAQSLLMQVGMDEEQKKQMKAVAIMNPLMIVMFSWSSPAGVTLYWVVGGFIGLVQQALTNFILKPRIRAKVEEEFKNNPPKPYKSTIKDVTPKASAIIEEKTSKKSNRNAGKQRSR
ncbi:TPA: membrane protein insertase YidC [Streptococcus suis]|uniref:membrane protein insertase YidC n=1 Tax=Streptococcus suis TaxID=1307 RepID=UPI002AAE1362|nr:membrane protein insertase YidC [Streptococcus suis]HEM5935628.1 membrane protein insertase YidC [Streptococcus suis]HEM5939635.1 membrane protein insertase YidC [Streptococcus suis]HEM5946084.1 membrane protein insertase YidC [Streptococcus suis]HEM5950252.1 membrane protein insertase YidC [Streptococcus suis]